MSEEAYDVGGGYDQTQTRFTAPAAGRYLFTCGGWGNANANGDRYAYCFRPSWGDYTHIGGGNYCLIDSPVSGYAEIIQLQKDDYVDFHMFTSIATTMGAGTHRFWWTGQLIG
jgi:hypothetical protein